MVDFNVAVILPAAGRGERMEGIPVKQCRDVLSKPLFLYPVEAFFRLPFVKRIVLVIPAYDLEDDRVLRPYREKIIIAIGGSSRHRSIRAGLIALQKEVANLSLKVVVIHDAVRPFVPESLVEDLVRAAHQCGAAGAVRPLVSTVLKPDNEGCLEETLDRNAYVASETPQAFQFHVLTNAYNQCADEELDDGTECLKLAHLYAGVRPQLFPGPPSLWKVTSKKDLYAAIGCLQEKNSMVCVVAAQGSDPARRLEARLQTLVSKVDRWSGVPATPVERSSTQVTYTSVVIFYQSECSHETPTLNFHLESNIPRSGILVRIIDCSRPGERWQDGFPEKGVAVIRRSNPRGDSRLLDMIMSMVMSPPDTYSQQLLFL